MLTVPYGALAQYLQGRRYLLKENITHPRSGSLAATYTFI